MTPKGVNIYKSVAPDITNNLEAEAGSHWKCCHLRSRKSPCWWRNYESWWHVWRDISLSSISVTNIDGWPQNITNLRSLVRQQLKNEVYSCWTRRLLTWVFALSKLKQYSRYISNDFWLDKNKRPIADIEFCRTARFIRRRNLTCRSWISRMLENIWAISLSGNRPGFDSHWTRYPWITWSRFETYSVSLVTNSSITFALFLRNGSERYFWVSPLFNRATKILLQKLSMIILVNHKW